LNTSSLMKNSFLISPFENKEHALLDNKLGTKAVRGVVDANLNEVFAQDCEAYFVSRGAFIQMCSSIAL